MERVEPHLMTFLVFSAHLMEINFLNWSTNSNTFKRETYFYFPISISFCPSFFSNICKVRFENLSILTIHLQTPTFFLNFIDCTVLKIWNLAWSLSSNSLKMDRVTYQMYCGIERCIKTYNSTTCCKTNDEANENLLGHL